MKVLSLLVCLAALAWGSSAARLQDGLVKLLASELDGLVAKQEMADVEDGQCKCGERGCFCTGKRGRTSASALMMLDQTKRSCHRCAHVAATFSVNTDIWEAVFPVNEDKEICHTVRGQEHCFNVDVKDPDTRGEKFMNGCVSLVKPVKMTLGCFNLPLVSVQAREDTDITSDWNDDDVIDEEPYL